MTTINISLPEALKAFVDTQVSNGGYGTASEYVRELIRKDQDRQQLRALLLAGAASAPADAAYFEALRDRVRKSLAIPLPDQPVTPTKSTCPACISGR